MNADFLIIGGGIGGTVLAELLARGRQRAVLLEKAITPPNWTRPEVLWPATPRLLFSLLPRSAWEENALLRLGGIDLWNGRRMIQLVSAETLGKTGVERWAADAVRTRELLLTQGSFELHRGAEVIAVLKQKARIVGVQTRHVITGRESEFLARWTIGDDGADSLVRRACDLEIEMRLFPLDFLCFDFSWPPSFEGLTPKVWLNTQGFRSGILALLAVPLPQRRGAGVVLVQPRSTEQDGPTQAAWERFCACDSALREVVGDRRFPLDFVRVRRLWGHVKQYGREGVILMGDASHPVSPAGGQGANMSVADARVLAEIGLRDSSSLLEEYERRRRGANERSLRFTRVAARVLDLPGRLPPVGVVVSVARWVSGYPSLLRPLIRYVSTAFEERNC